MAPQYVLTARHCVRAGALSRIRVVAGSGTLRVAQAAAVLPAPRVKGRRPDLALVQLTSRSALAPARLGGGSSYALPRARSQVVARGWRTERSARDARGSVLRRAAACGARPAGSG